MKAICLNYKNGPEGLVAMELPRPEPKAGEVRVKVHATAITPAEFQWYPTFNTPAGEPRAFPVVLSHEFSGVVDSLGANAAGFRVGDAVYGLNDWFSNGAQTEYCVAAVTAVAHKPESLDHAHAAVVPISALTAWQGLIERTGLERGQRVLVHGGAGGVGIFAVQLARWRGAHVVATASAANLDFVRSLGADEVIDYRTKPFEGVARDIDVVFDGVGGETLERSWPLLKPGGRLVTVATQSEATADQRTHDAFMLVRADGSQLSQIAGLIEKGALRVFIEQSFPLARAREAYARALQGKMRGKIALRVFE